MDQRVNIIQDKLQSIGMGKLNFLNANEEIRPQVDQTQMMSINSGQEKPSAQTMQQMPVSPMVVRIPVQNQNQQEINALEKINELKQLVSEAEGINT